MGTYALVKYGTVINTIIWGGPQESPIEFEEDIIPIEITGGAVASIGYSYLDGEFRSPPLTKEQQTQIEYSALQGNVSNKELLMSAAGQKISVLQDAVDLDMATDYEAASLKLWKKYRVLLSRLDANTSDDMTWPEKPD
ncbi:tail fiber assembly protein [Pantoea anthophila]|uniref:tail fiber assembly protein n=1 Tax=Pantoea anthophila TaxID=470931 RepID=UPI0030165060